MYQTRSRAWLLRSVLFLVAFFLICVVAMGAYWNNATPTASTFRQEDKEKEVRQFVESIGVAFNRHDSKAIGGMFLPEGELVDDAGNVLKNRGSLEAHYAEIFKTHPQSRLALTNESLRTIGESLAMYDGVAEVKLSANEPLRRTRFAAVLNKQGNQWQVASIRDLEDMDNDPAVIRDKLNALEFLVGDWVQEEGNHRIYTSCQWSEDKMSLIQKFQISGANIKSFSGTQRIAWDPATQKIKSWTHDALGGYAEALWTNSEDSWIVKSSGTNSDGEACSMTSVYRQAGNGRIDNYFRDRIVGDDLMPDIAATIVRKPPEPKP